uniref:Uncharacterized protein n=1 Tax=Setaria italica TaxID=4555 RepID=K4ANR2_SETIT
MLNQWFESPPPLPASTSSGRISDSLDVASPPPPPASNRHTPSRVSPRTLATAATPAQLGRRHIRKQALCNPRYLHLHILQLRSAIESRTRLVSFSSVMALRG